MKYFLLVILIRLSFVNAQSVFNNVYDYGDNGYEVFNYADTVDNFIIAVGNSAPPISLANRDRYICLVDSTGQAIRKIRQINTNVETSITKHLVRLDNFLYIFGGSFHPDESWNGFMLKIDFDGNVFLDTLINIGFYSGIDYVLPYKNGLLLLGFVYDNIGLDSSLATLTHIDTLGNIIDVRYFGSSGYDFARCMKPTDDRGFIISGRTDNHPIRLESNYFLLKVDSNLNQEWMYEYGDSTVDQYVRAFNSLEISQDKNFYFIFGEERYFSSVIGFNTAKAKLLKIFKGGNFIWEKTFDLGPTQYAQSIRGYSDGTLLLTGGVTRDFQGNYTYPRGFLLKVDEEGEVIWERRYSKWWWDGSGNPPLVNEDYVHNMIITQDGGILVSGYQIHDMPTNNDAWLIKFDSCGYTVGDIPEPLFVIENQNGLAISLENLSEHYCTATLTWGDGEAEQIYAYSEPIYGYSPNLTHTYAEPGTYEICLEALAGEEYRTYCTEVNIEPNSINSLTQGGGLGEGVKIFPNPSRDYFILELPNHPPNGGNQGGNNSLPLGEGWGGAYSLTGQLVHQFSIKPQPQQKIDISHLAEGVYIISVEINGEYVGTDKLVVVR
jgi:hypothetical protein